jgi:hypothetical protein
MVTVIIMDDNLYLRTIVKIIFPVNEFIFKLCHCYYYETACYNVIHESCVK